MLTIRTIEELEALAGTEIGCGDWFTIDQELISNFGTLTRDEFWTHMDPERCRRESPFGQTIAHGAMMLSLITYLVRQVIDFQGEVPVTFSYGFNRVRYPAPSLCDARFRMRLGLQRIERAEGHMQAYWDVKIETDAGPKPVLAAEWITRTYFGMVL